MPAKVEPTHAIHRWSGLPLDETPYCGKRTGAALVMRTDYKIYGKHHVTCKSCLRIMSLIERVSNAC
jgi:hypothetical protein